MFSKVGSVVDHKFLLFYTYSRHRYALFCIAIKRQYIHPLAQQLTGCPMCLSRGLPRAECWGRLASDLTVNYKRLVWPEYTRTTRGSLLLRGRWGPLWAVRFVPAAQGFVCPPVSPIVNQPTRLLRRRSVFVHARENHAAAHGRKKQGISHAPIFAAILVLQRGSGEL